MTDAVKVCPICDIAGCAHIRERAYQARIAELETALKAARADALRETSND